MGVSAWLTACDVVLGSWEIGVYFDEHHESDARNRVFDDATGVTWGCGHAVGAVAFS
jgi:hypothetical protein